MYFGDSCTIGDTVSFEYVTTLWWTLTVMRTTGHLVCKNCAGGVEPSGTEKKMATLRHAWRTIGDSILGVRIQWRIVMQGVVVYDC
jgi:hypothetical protein